MIEKVEDITKQIKKLKKQRKALIAEKRKSSFTGYGLISGCIDAVRVNLLSGYAVKYSLTDDSKYCILQKTVKQSFLPDMIRVVCITPIRKEEYDFLLSKNSGIEQYLKDNFPDDFNWSE